MSSGIVYYLADVALGALSTWFRPNPKPASATDDWDTRARRAVDAEAARAGELASFLEDWPDIVREKYLLLLEHALEHHRGNDVLFNAILLCVRRSLHFHSTAPKLVDSRWSIRELRQRRETWEKTIPRISYYDIFVASIERWNPQDAAGTDPIFDCPVITKKILDYAQSELWREGAIHACAEHGLSTLLLHILDNVMPAGDDNVVEQMQIAFLCGPDAEVTSLGTAIRKQINFLFRHNATLPPPVTGRSHLDCIRVLLGMRPQVADYITQGMNVLTDDSSDMPLLHTTLKWAREAIGMTQNWRQNPEDRTIGLERLLRTIIGADRGLLTHRDKNGAPPYQYAVSVLSSFGDRRIQDFLRTEVFKLGDPDLVAMALYSKDGEFVS